jgi:hypothetical protein
MWMSHMFSAIGGMKVNKPLKHNNSIPWLSCFNFKFKSTLLLFELASKDGIEQNLGRITKGHDSLRFKLELKKTKMIDIYFTVPTPCWTHDIHMIYDKKFQNNLSDDRTQD